MRKRTISFVAVLIGLLLWGCYPDGPDYTEDLDIVVTHHNPDYDFVAKSTYAMPDQIVKITGNVQEGESPEWIPEVTASSILGRIAENMASLGWNRVELDASPAPDLVLLPASWETTTIYYYYDYWYWWYGGYPGYGYPGYGYPGYSYGGSYTTGTLMMSIRDDNELNGSGTPVNQWTGAINGILGSKYDASRVQPLIDQAFEQSPYLKTN